MQAVKRGGWPYYCTTALLVLLLGSFAHPFALTVPTSAWKGRQKVSYLGHPALRIANNYWHVILTKTTQLNNGRTHGWMVRLFGILEHLSSRCSCCRGVAVMESRASRAHSLIVTTHLQQSPKRTHACSEAKTRHDKCLNALHSKHHISQKSESHSRHLLHYYTNTHDRHQQQQPCSSNPDPDLEHPWFEG